ncbi:natural resistance-associated macrophage protein-domain-containing protein [Crucibulum laeve]|uniref:Natural resistance-associated macrophage protein-domain-containing protein n=1 Tax=Crucibulum laeve TaxID=68775 RepID=A0A5C3MAF5_9AGAR|nr:natural resistance-associated macrophage protein-domain-containing protein [Crucibulum laeve]
MSASAPTIPNAREPSSRQVGVAQRLKSFANDMIYHVKKHTGVGIVCAVAYFDPGNWGVDLQAGSQFGYRLLFVVLLAGLFAVFLQVLASRLGCVTGLDLASHTRLLLYNRPKHKLLYRWLGLYPLYVLAEVAIIATDLAELLGSAIALCMLFPKLELWHGVLLTAVDVFVILAMGDPLRGRPVRAFEFLIAGMVLAVMICMIVIISKVDVNWGHAFEGYIPSKYIFQSGGLYTSVGILGATVMPHSLFLGSALATQDRISYHPKKSEKLALAPTDSKDSDESEVVAAKQSSRMHRYLESCKESVMNAFRVPPKSMYSTTATRHGERENNPLAFVKAHIYHGIIDVVGSLLGFAVMINSLILILAAAVFYFGKGSTGEASPASLFDAYDLIRDLVGQPAATLFAIALLAAGQSSSIIATIAGQAVSEGFLQWRVSPVVRRLVTRLLAIIPSMAVAIAVGRKGIDDLLVASQVILSIVLPFITFPLLYCTASKAIMSVRKTDTNVDPATHGSAENAGDNTEDFSNSKLTILIGVCIWLVVMAANFYVIVSLAMGQEI